MPRVHCNLISFVSGKTGGAEVFVKALVPLIAERGTELIVHGSKATCEWINTLCTVGTREIPKPKSNLGITWAMRNMAKHREGNEVVWSPLNQGVGIASVPEVLTIHDLIPRHYARNEGNYSSNLKRAIRCWTRWTNTIRVAKKARVICAVSDAIADELRQELPFANEVVGIPNGMSQQRYNNVADWSPEQPPKVIAATSGAWPHKGLTTLEEVARRMPDIQFRVIGKGGMKSDLSNLVLTGWLSDEEYAQEFSTASALLFPSRIEGFGLPVLEALQYGTPVVASDIPVLREVGGENSKYFSVGDAESAVAQLRTVVSDSALANQMSTAGKEHAKPFTWERAAGQYTELFERLSQEA